MASPNKCPACAAENDPQLDVCVTCGTSLQDLKPGSVVAGRFELLELLGKGGMGHVFRAHDRSLDEAVALKILRPELSRSEEMVRRFRNEVRLARMISHSNVTRLYDYGLHAGLEYISMELVEGTNLRTTLRRRGRGLARAEAFGAVISAAAGLQAIHDAGIVHRDLKTENIIIDKAGVVRLMDFGIAKGLVQKAGAPLTRVGMILGTPQYMSPEQCQAGALDKRSDIYSLGIVCHEIFTGTLPFDDESPLNTMMLHIKEPPPLELARKRGLPKSLVAPLSRALAKDPDDRFQDATDFKLAVVKARDQSRTEISDRVSVVEDPERRRNRRVDVLIDCWIRILGEDGKVIREARGVADNIGGGGARVRTRLAQIEVGQHLVLEEADASFKARAEVRALSVGADGIPRVHLKFIEDQSRPVTEVRRIRLQTPSF